MRCGDTIYWAKVIKDENGRITGWETPREIELRPNYFTLKPTKAYSDIVVYGKDVYKLYIGLAPFDIWGASFSEDDRFYLDYTKPTNEEENGDTANARCKAVSYQNLFIRLTIERLAAPNEFMQY